MPASHTLTLEEQAREEKRAEIMRRVAAKRATAEAEKLGLDEAGKAAAVAAAVAVQDEKIQNETGLKAKNTLAGSSDLDEGTRARRPAASVSLLAPALKRHRRTRSDSIASQEELRAA